MPLQAVVKLLRSKREPEGYNAEKQINMASIPTLKFHYFLPEFLYLMYIYLKLNKRNKKGLAE